MKYVLMFAGTTEEQDQWEKLSKEQLANAYQNVNKWFEENGKAGRIVGGEELQGPGTATTVHHKNGKITLTDGPFIEAKEVIGGFAVVEVKDLDEALEMAKLARRQHGRSPPGRRSQRHAALRGPSAATDAAVAAVFREEAGRLTGALVRALGDFELAEEVVQDSIVATLEKWPQQVLLYDALLRLAETPIVRLNRAVALSHFAGPEVALGEINDLAMSLKGYHLFHATRAELLDEVGEKTRAREARLRALELCQNPAERRLLEKKLGG